MYKVNSVFERKSILSLLFIILCVWVFSPSEVLDDFLLSISIISILAWVCICTQTKNYNGRICILNSIFFQVLLGLEHKTPQGVAHHFVLMIGLTLEWYILYAGFVEFTSYEDNFYSTALNFLSVAIISSLLIHQILIFRNFSVAGSPLFSKTPYLWLVTFSIFIGIGAVAGEFGYLFAISKLSSIGVDGGIPHLIMDLLGTSSTYLTEHNLIPEDSNIVREVLKRSLKGIFVVGAFCVCILVLIWDFLVDTTENNIDKELLRLFKIMDGLSFCIWILVSTITIPRMMITKEITITAFIFLAAFYISYTSYRVFLGYLKIKNTEKNTSEVAI